MIIINYLKKYINTINFKLLFSEVQVNIAYKCNDAIDNNI